MVRLASRPRLRLPLDTPWLGEVAVTASHFRRQGMLTTINERVRFVASRFGHYDLIDFVIVLMGYVISGERTLETFFKNRRTFTLRVLTSERQANPAKGAETRPKRENDGCEVWQ